MAHATRSRPTEAAAAEVRASPDPEPAIRIASRYVADAPRGATVHDEPATSDDQRRMARLLTRREAQVLQRVARGMSAKEVGRSIDIAPRTVERHIENIRVKIGARNRVHMIFLGFSKGILQLFPAIIGIAGS